MVIVIDKNSDKKTIEASLKKIQVGKKKFKLSDFAGKLKGVFGDGVDFQKKIRNEWD
ncbi:hypothetical protein [Pedobacter rhizosphaerae]|uniref:Uncharacterized protein n=1 Tax=Pedobacter rhizosphaerae TaxID=390241 RepID=A0A1H9NUM7_9SPHI|nr:hypothetical protein [Pedobacter rhizosphaerae]SER39686.1 hypothetical protein SAMN04488023_108133 [Pedobacter rhizosphaerae]